LLCTKHYITSQARGWLAAAAVAVGGSLDCAGGHGGVGTIDVVVVLVLMFNGILNCQHDSAGASECQQKASVIVDAMGCSGGWNTTTVATKHSIHSTSLQDILLTSCTTETKKQPIEPNASNNNRTSRRVAIPLTHEHQTEQQQGQAISCYEQNIASHISDEVCN
jgi:hypothetical protein